MFFGGIGRAKTKLGGNFGACRWKSGALDSTGDQFKNLLLSCGQFIHGLTVCLNSGCIFIQYSYQGQALFFLSCWETVVAGAVAGFRDVCRTLAASEKRGAADKL